MAAPHTSPPAGRSSICLLTDYHIADADLAAYMANPPKHRRRNTLAPSTPDLEERYLLEGRTWPDWKLPASPAANLL